MATLEKIAPGAFSWIELATTDQDAAKSFYANLFGWTINDFPMGPAGVYTMFQIDGRDVAAAAGQQPAEKEMGVPPHWNLYVAVEDADATSARATELGGKVLAGPFDVNDFGRMAVLMDPTGAVISLWQARTHVGIRVAGEPGTLCWAELSTPDTKAATDFYSGAFGWTIGAQDPSGYLHIGNGATMIGGIPPAEHRNANMPPHWMLYLLVDDCDASTAKARELGATVYAGPMDIPKVGRMSVVADPQGAAFSLFQPGRES